MDAKLQAPEKKKLNLKVKTLEKKTAPMKARGSSPVIGYT